MTYPPLSSKSLSFPGKANPLAPSSPSRPTNTPEENSIKIESLFQTLDGTEEEILTLLHRVKETVAICKQLHENAVPGILTNSLQDGEISQVSSASLISPQNKKRKIENVRDDESSASDDSNDIEEIESENKNENKVEYEIKEEKHLLASLEENASSYLDSVCQIRDRLIEFGKSYINPYLPYQNNCYIDRTRVEVLEMVLANYQTRLIDLKERKKYIYEKNQNGSSIKEEAN